MDAQNTPSDMNDRLAALADGELDMRDQPELFAQLAQDPQAAQRIAQYLQLKHAVAGAMDGPQMKCPADLAAKLTALAEADVAQADVAQPAEPQPATTPQPKPAPPAYAGPSVIARIGQWAPTAVAAVLLIAAGVLFTQSDFGGGGINAQAASFLSIEQVSQFTGRHTDCATELSLLKETETFGDASEFDQLPGKLGNYFKASTDGMRLSLDGVGYDYQLTGACPLPGKGAVHIVYRNHDDPTRAISVWVKPADEEHKDLQPDRVYVEAGQDLERPVIFWRDGGLLYYLVGDSLEDCNKAVKELRQSA